MSETDKLTEETDDSDSVQSENINGSGREYLIIFVGMMVFVVLINLVFHWIGIPSMFD